MGRVAAFLVLAFALAAPARAQQAPSYTERVEVTRLLIDARVLDDSGRPVRGLAAEDFRVKIGGKVARVESAQWVGGEAPDDGSTGEEAGAGAGFPDQGRLIVFVFQKSMEASRIRGFMQMLIEARGLLESMTPRDRIAVLSFDSRLQVWIDFTNNFARVRRVFERGILFERAGPVQEAADVSLLRRLDVAEARRTYTIERALRRIGDALVDLPGAKSIVLVGHGFGHFTPVAVTMDAEYGPMRESLQHARASVFSLDVTRADYHSLEAGLQLVAEHTGGFFARTHEFRAPAVRKLLGALAGYYTLFVELPVLDEGTHGTDVALTRGKGEVLARSRYIVATTPAKAPTAERDESCRVTDRSKSFTPPPPYPGVPPIEQAFWYGTPALWTMLPASGAWAGGRQKVFLWRPGYDGRVEQWPNATVSARRLDGPSAPIVVEPASNAYRRDFGGWAMLVEIEIPTDGCWEITGAYGDARVVFTVHVAASGILDSDSGF